MVPGQGSESAGAFAAPVYGSDSCGFGLGPLIGWSNPGGRDHFICRLPGSLVWDPLVRDKEEKSFARCLTFGFLGPDLSNGGSDLRGPEMRVRNRDGRRVGSSAAMGWRYTGASNCT